MFSECLRNLQFHPISATRTSRKPGFVPSAWKNAAPAALKSLNLSIMFPMSFCVFLWILTEWVHVWVCVCVCVTSYRWLYYTNTQGAQQRWLKGREETKRRYQDAKDEGRLKERERERRRWKPAWKLMEQLLTAARLLSWLLRAVVCASWLSDLSRTGPNLATWLPNLCFFPSLSVPLSFFHLLSIMLLWTHPIERISVSPPIAPFWQPDITQRAAGWKRAAGEVGVAASRGSEVSLQQDKGRMRWGWVASTDSVSPLFHPLPSTQSRPT